MSLDRDPMVMHEESLKANTFAQNNQTSKFVNHRLETGMTGVSIFWYCHFFICLPTRNFS
jgi:hypothetical protein